MLNGFENKYSEFATKKWYVIDSESKDSHNDAIKFLTKSIESSFFDYSDAYILVTGNATVTRTIAAAGDKSVQRKQPLAAVIQVVFKNCAPFEKCSTEIDGTLVDEANFINITMPMYKYKYQASNIGNTESNGTKNGVKIAVPLKYLSSFWRSLGMPLINCKVELSL